MVFEQLEGTFSSAEEKGDSWFKKGKLCMLNRQDSSNCCETIPLNAAARGKKHVK